MNLIEVIRSGKKCSRVDIYDPIQFFSKHTGPFKHNFDCGYFVVDGEGIASVDLYADEITAEYRIIE